MAKWFIVNKNVHGKVGIGQAQVHFNENGVAVTEDPQVAEHVKKLAQIGYTLLTEEEAEKIKSKQSEVKAKLAAEEEAKKKASEEAAKLAEKTATDKTTAKTKLAEGAKVKAVEETNANEKASKEEKK